MNRTKFVIYVLIGIIILGIASPVLAAISNITIERTIYDQYWIKWDDGPSRSDVQLKQGDNTVYTRLNARFGRVLFSTIAPGNYDFYLDNNYLAHVNIATSGTPQITTAVTDPFFPELPPTPSEVVTDPSFPEPPSEVVTTPSLPEPEPAPGDSDNLGVIVVQPTPQPTGSDSILNNEQTREYLSDSDNQPGYGERFIAGILTSAVSWIMNLFRLSDPVLLVFGKDPRIDDTDDFLAGGLYGTEPRDNLILGTFPLPFFGAISIIYTAFERILPIPLVISLIIISLILMFNSGTSEGRNQLKEYLRAFVVALVAIRFGHMLWYWVFEINYLLVDLIWAHMMNSGVGGGFFLDMVWGTGRTGFDETVKIGSLPLALILCVATFMALILNYQYTIRLIILGILIMIFPIVCVLSVFPAFKHALTTWMQEFMANVFLNFAHALALGAFFIFIAMPGVGEGAGFWISIAFFIGLPTIVGVVRQLLGLEGKTSGLGAAGAMMGVMAALNIGRMITSKRGGAGGGAAGGDLTGSDLPSDGGITGGSPSPSTTPNTPLSGATSKTGKMAQGAYNTISAAGSAVGPAARGIAKVGIGAAAAVTGGILSTMATGNPVTGAVLGGALGGVAFKGVDAVSKGAGSMMQSTAEAVNSGGGVAQIADTAKTGMMDTMINPQGSIGKAASSAGWGLMRATNAVSGVLGKEAPFQSVGAMDANREIINNSTESMRNMKPDLDTATSRYDQMKAQYGKGSAWYDQHRNPQTGKILMPDEYTKSEQTYNQLKAQHSSHRTNMLQAQGNVSSYQRLKASYGNMGQDNSTYSPGRGQI